MTRDATGAAIAPHLAVMERLYESGGREALRDAVDAATNPRRARAQAQPRGDGGRFESEDPWVRVRASELETEREWWRGRLKQSAKEVRALTTTVAERDADLAVFRQLLESSRSEIGDIECMCQMLERENQALAETEIALRNQSSTWRHDLSTVVGGVLLAAGLIAAIVWGIYG